METIIDVIKVLISGAIFFVWVVRYSNIVTVFEEYNYPTWLRDITGILKISFAIMLFHSNPNLVMLAAMGIAALMFAAVITHLRVKNPIHKILPSISLFTLSLIVFFATYL